MPAPRDKHLKHNKILWSQRLDEYLNVPLKPPHNLSPCSARMLPLWPRSRVIESGSVPFFSPPFHGSLSLCALLVFVKDLATTILSSLRLPHQQRLPPFKQLPQGVQLASLMNCHPHMFFTNMFFPLLFLVMGCHPASLPKLQMPDSYMVSFCMPGMNPCEVTGGTGTDGMKHVSNRSDKLLPQFLQFIWREKIEDIVISPAMLYALTKGFHAVAKFLYIFQAVNNWGFHPSRSYEDTHVLGHDESQFQLLKCLSLLQSAGHKRFLEAVLPRTFAAAIRCFLPCGCEDHQVFKSCRQFTGSAENFHTINFNIGLIPGAPSALDPSDSGVRLRPSWLALLPQRCSLHPFWAWDL